MLIARFSTVTDVRRAIGGGIRERRGQDDYLVASRSLKARKERQSWQVGAKGFRPYMPISALVLCFQIFIEVIEGALPGEFGADPLPGR